MPYEKNSLKVDKRVSVVLLFQKTGGDIRRGGFMGRIMKIVCALLLFFLSFLSWASSGKIGLDVYFLSGGGALLLVSAFSENIASSIRKFFAFIRSRETRSLQCQYVDHRGNRCGGRGMYIISFVAVPPRGNFRDPLAGNSLILCDDHHPEIGKEGAAIKDLTERRNIKHHLIASLRSSSHW